MSGSDGSVQHIVKRNTTYRRGIIHVEMGLFDTLTMVTLRIG
jgi:hypothetical protein